MFSECTVLTVQREGSHGAKPQLLVVRTVCDRRYVYIYMYMGYIRPFIKLVYILFHFYLVAVQQDR